MRGIYLNFAAHHLQWSSFYVSEIFSNETINIEQSINQSMLSIKFSLDDISIKRWHYYAEFSSISIMSAWLYVYEGSLWRMQWDHQSCHALPRFWRLRFNFIEKEGKHRIFSLRVVTWDANMFSWSRGIKLGFFLIDCSLSQAIRLSISEKIFP